MIEQKTAITRRRALQIAASVVNESRLEGQVESVTPGQGGFTVQFEKPGPSGPVTAALTIRLSAAGCRFALAVNVKLDMQMYSVDTLPTVRALLYDLLVLGSFVQQSLNNFDITDPN